MGLEPAGDRFDFAEDAEEVAAEGLAAVVGGVAAGHEGGEEPGAGGRGFCAEFDRDGAWGARDFVV